ncbi:MAG: hypothetical protein M1823_002961 [Watsoniomyces obsoletus]|nr:MAG: hypothetical protein M1823_002961 [Watsoniomyces obsoletus]
MSWFTSCFSIFRDKPRTGPGSSVDRWMEDVYAKRAVADPWATKRYLPCRVLRDEGFACLAWFEHPVRYYGVPTELFNLYLLVEDVDEASRALTDKGWTHIKPPAYSFLDSVEADWRWLSAPRREGEQQPLLSVQSMSVVVLGSVKDWNINLPDVWCVQYRRPLASERWPYIPTFPDLMNALFEKWLCGPEDQCDLQRRDEAFTDYLQMEFRHLHQQILAGVHYLSPQYWKFQRDACQKIREGHDPAEFLEEGWAIHRAIKAEEASLLAAMPRVHAASESGEDEEDGDD